MTLPFSVVGLLRELIERAERDEHAEPVDPASTSQASC